MTDQQVDILIIGGGLIGAALMLALVNKGLNCLLIEAQPLRTGLQDDFDARTLALSPASINILTMLGVWNGLGSKATAIKTIHVSEQFRFGTARLKATVNEVLGYVIELPIIQQAFNQRLNPDCFLAPAQLVELDREQGVATIQHGDKIQRIQAQLIVGADGGQSALRRLSGLSVTNNDYDHQALVTNIGLSRDHRHCAYERFTQQGPLAMLPLTQQRAALVWCLPPEQAQQLATVEEKQFLKQLQQSFGYKLGRFVKAGRREIFPLKKAVMPETVRWPLVFIGNAAQTLHPVAGQGFNLGLRDVAALAQCIIQLGLNPAMLTSYQAMRKADQTAIIGLTDGLIRLFNSRLPGLGLGRSLGLMMMDNIPLLKSILGHYARGYGGIVPDLACKIALDEER